ncbi:MAG TPA: hypothetical protein GXZ87_08725 [Bacteroidales bacterium]|nr:hypothetical protein [Bacteroidales bacterium]
MKKNEDFLKKVFGKLFANKGYIGKQLFETLFIDDIYLVIKNMKYYITNPTFFICTYSN